MSLPTRPLGSSGFQITTVGFGSWAVGGGGWSYGWGPQDDAESIATMRHALELGINWIDTAAVYGLGHSGSCREIIARHSYVAAAPDLHKMRVDLGRRQTDGSRQAHPETGIDPARVRSVAAAAGRRTHRSLSISPAG